MIYSTMLSSSVRRLHSDAELCFALQNSLAKFLLVPNFLQASDRCGQCSNCFDAQMACIFIEPSLPSTAGKLLADPESSDACRHKHSLWEGQTAVAQNLHAYNRVHPRKKVCLSCFLALYCGRQLALSRVSS